MNHFITNDVVITEKELIGEIVNLKEKIRELEIERRVLRKIKNQYRTFAPKINEPYFFTDLDGKILESNEGFQNLLGYSFYDLKRMTIKSITPFALHDNETKLLIEELENNPVIKGRFAEYYKINGEKIQVELDIFATFDEQDKFEGISRVIKNI